MSTDLCFTPARELARMLRAREVSAREVMQAFLAQIGRHNPTLNAIVGKLPDEACLALADRADCQRGDSHLGPLHGLPMAFKDHEPAAGLAWTNGSRIFKDRIADEDSVLVERLRRAGVVPIGKTNISEFTMGSQTYNDVYGTTRNPWDPTKTAGGSSGGAAAAVAAGMLPFADGSDLGGSLRNPASFNSLVALRPTVGLVPNAPVAFPLIEFLAKGVIARTVDDVAFALSAVAGPDDRDPRTFPSDPRVFRTFAPRSVRGLRVAWCPDLGGLPLDPRVRAVLDRHRATFEAICGEGLVADAAPDLRVADDVFLTLRTWMSAQTLGPLLDSHRDLMKPEAIWQIEQGRAVTAADLARAMRAHAALLEQMRTFFDRHEFIVCATSQVPPFDATLTWPRQIDGVQMEHYIAWMRSAYWISATLGPAVSVPAGVTSDGLPVGLQIVSSPRRDLAVLQLARAFEEASGVGQSRPLGATPAPVME